MHGDRDIEPFTRRIRALSRRDALRWLGSTLASVPILSGWGCSDDAGARQRDAGERGRDAGLLEGGSGMDARTKPGRRTEAGAAGDSGARDSGGADIGASDAGDHADAGDAARSDGGRTRIDGWASGGTDAMTGGYPNPFTSRPSSGCTPTCSMTLGPCHDDRAPEREDISEGEPGLPMRLGLRILDTACQPVTDANVDLWHCDAMGVYSSETNDLPAFCTGDRAGALAARFFRGHRMTNAQGIAWFNSVFPGWYTGRAIHIHLTVRRANRQGQEYLTSQVAFPTELVNEICGNHPDYASHGLPDTSNASDSVFPAADVGRYVVETQRMPDGVLLAWKTILIRSSLSDPLCTA